jgi:hypothetical protein
VKAGIDNETTQTLPAADRPHTGNEEFVHTLMNLRDGLERLLTGSDQSEPADPERSVRQERSLELLLWLLNLESRLPPYGDEQPA